MLRARDTHFSTDAQHLCKLGSQSAHVMPERGVCEAPGSPPLTLLKGHVMTSIKQITTFLASLVVASVALNTTLNAQQGSMFCIPTYEQLIEQTEKKELVLAFAGVARQGQPLWFFVNDTDWSVFFKDRTTGHYCTAPNYYGATVNATPVEE